MRSSGRGRGGLRRDPRAAAAARAAVEGKDVFQRRAVAVEAAEHKGVRARRGGGGCVSIGEKLWEVRGPHGQKWPQERHGVGTVM